MKNIFFPWKRISELEQDLAAEREKVEALQRELDLQKVNKAKSVLIISNLRATIAKGHYRNPETGRLGRKGQLFEGTKP